VPGDTKGYWCLNCKLTRLERKSSSIEYHFHMAPLPEDTKLDVKFCEEFKR